MTSAGPGGTQALGGLLAGLATVATQFAEALAAPAPDPGQSEHGEQHHAGFRASAGVPAEVCAHCPICQGAAVIERYGPELAAEFGALARAVIDGLSAAMDAAAETRQSRQWQGADPEGQAP